MKSIGDLEEKTFGDTWRQKSLRLLLLLRFTKLVFYKFKISDNSMDDHQQSLSPVSLVHSNMVDIIKKTGVNEVGTKKKKRNLHRVELYFLPSSHIPPQPKKYHQLHYDIIIFQLLFGLGSCVHFLEFFALCCLIFLSSLLVLHSLSICFSFRT
ncbi:uncharacterized protein [Nicotiana tomentosiformis]|uniref:uncharacterized protein isoform X1 n=1 Tax=Nicotiana tomentosiformis TaxID=4098 RepID=UPI00388CBD5C